ncbi:MAG: helix-turn-helix domain-containing protein [Victivallaceae bacterium]|nr:helix-turn-helix domain-containing protein [Victivallaceae bacterium]
MDYNRWQAIDQKIRELIVSAFNMAGINFVRDYVGTENKEYPCRDKEEWLDLKQAAAFACVSPYTVRRWIRTRGLKGRKLNGAKCGRILVHAESLRHFIETQQEA